MRAWSRTSGLTKVPLTELGTPSSENWTVIMRSWGEPLWQSLTCKGYYEDFNDQWGESLMTLSSEDETPPVPVPCVATEPNAVLGVATLCEEGHLDLRRQAVVTFVERIQVLATQLHCLVLLLGDLLPQPRAESCG